MAALAQDPANGALLAGLGGCANCHGTDLAGGEAIVTDYGTFYGSNLTPDAEHGIGSWSYDDFERAMQHGKSPEGRLWPAFPFPSFTLMTQPDMADLWAYLQSVEPVDRANTPHEVKGRYRGMLGMWRLLAFKDRTWTPDPDASDAVNRGDYLVNAVGHCGECHTERGWTGRVKQRHALAGTSEGPEPGPNITPSSDGIGGWSTSDLTGFFEYGVDPDGDVVGSAMYDVIDRGTALLSDSDRAAIVAYLQSLEPKESR